MPLNTYKQYSISLRLKYTIHKIHKNLAKVGQPFKTKGPKTKHGWVKKWGRLQKPTPYRLMHGNGRRRRCRAVWSGVRPMRGERRPNTERTKWMEDLDEEEGA